MSFVAFVVVAVEAVGSSISSIGAFPMFSIAVAVMSFGISVLAFTVDSPEWQRFVLATKLL